LAELTTPAFAGPLVCLAAVESAILPAMCDEAVEIIPCPAAMVGEALTLVLHEIAPEHREVVAPQLSREQSAQGRTIDGLWVACHDRRLVAATWAQQQPGNTAILWPPQSLTRVDRGLARQLCEYAVASLDLAGVDMAQVVLPDRQAAVIPDLNSVGFGYLADLLYLKWEVSGHDDSSTEYLSSEPSGPLHFEPYDEALRERTTRIVERTYEGTQDCPAMNGKRQMIDVIDGYQATGVFRPNLWSIVCAGGEDVGVLLLTEHPAARHLELIYMGLVPEARGRGWGGLISQQAQRISVRAGVDRLVLAVDAVNEPALAMYREVGFRGWDQRSVFVRSRQA
jgi:ribosomal protein S18 acetylase RimI-like enzyme